jgi:transposase-like protein
MVIKILRCYHCGSDKLNKHGLTRNGKQRYWCQSCQRSSREDPQVNGYSEAERTEILCAYEERSSMRGLTRTFGVARNTVSGWLKKKTPRSRP